MNDARRAELRQCELDVEALGAIAFTLYRNQLIYRRNLLLARIEAICEAEAREQLGIDLVRDTEED